ncbi:hypothetical protein PCYB_004230, partial [Plasmodium cynomolgi strain B]
YDSFEQYRHNHDVYVNVENFLANELDSFPNDILGEETENKSDISKDCLRLKKYLIKFQNEDGCKKENCCQYINYLLNKAVRTYYKSNKSIFDIYIKYMNHESNSMIKNSWLPEINYMEIDKYNKIDKLYSVYKNCMFKNSKMHDSISCHYAKLCANSYNNIMYLNVKLDDTKFCKKLKELKVFLEENEPPLTSYCDLKHSVSLFYPYVCNDLLQKSEKIKENMVTTNMGIELQGTLVVPSVEQRQRIPEVGSPAVPEGGMDTEETVTP